MFHVRAEIFDSSAREFDPEKTSLIMSTVHAVYYSETRQAMLIPCTDMSVLFKKMSREFYANTTRTCDVFRADAITKVVDLTPLGTFLRAPSMADVDSIVASRRELYDNSACDRDSSLKPSINKVSRMFLP